jgi:hypothetical protein
MVVVSTRIALFLVIRKAAAEGANVRITRIRVVVFSYGFAATDADAWFHGRRMMVKFWIT